MRALRRRNSCSVPPNFPAYHDYNACGRLAAIVAASPHFVIGGGEHQAPFLAFGNRLYRREDSAPKEPRSRPVLSGRLGSAMSHPWNLFNGVHDGQTWMVNWERYDSSG